MCVDRKPKWKFFKKINISGADLEKALLRYIFGPPGCFLDAQKGLFLTTVK